MPDTGDLREDVLALLRSGAERLYGLFGEAARGLMAEALTNPGRTTNLRATMSTSRDQRMRESWSAPQLEETSPPPRSHHT